MNATDSPPRPSDDAAARLAATLKSGRYVPFDVDLPDKEFAYVRLSIYGSIETNELFVKLTNGKSTFVGAVESPLISPGMADRIFGMDVLDAEAAFALANRMWEDHRDVLVQDPGTELGDHA